FLSGPQNQVLSVAVWGLWEGGNFGPATAGAVFLVVLIGVLTVVTFRLTGLIGGSQQRGGGMSVPLPSQRADFGNDVAADAVDRLEVPDVAEVQNTVLHASFGLCAKSFDQLAGGYRHILSVAREKGRSALFRAVMPGLPGLEGAARHLIHQHEPIH